MPLLLSRRQALLLALTLTLLAPGAVRAQPTLGLEFPPSLRLNLNEKDAVDA